MIIIFCPHEGAGGSGPGFCVGVEFQWGLISKDNALLVYYMMIEQKISELDSALFLEDVLKGICCKRLKDTAIHEEAMMTTRLCD